MGVMYQSSGIAKVRAIGARSVTEVIGTLESIWVIYDLDCEVCGGNGWFYAEDGDEEECWNCGDGMTVEQEEIEPSELRSAIERVFEQPNKRMNRWHLADDLGDRQRGAAIVRAMVEKGLLVYWSVDEVALP